MPAAARPVLPPAPTHALIFANGDPGDGIMPARALHAAPPDVLIIAADGGARVARHFGMTPHLVIGDLDSIMQGDLTMLEAQGVEVVRHPPEKDETDLELALVYAIERGVRWLRIIGGIGDRLDQTLANIYLLSAPSLAGCDARIVAGRQEAWLIGAGQHVIDGAVGDTVSLLPITGIVGGVTTGALHYPLRGETLTYHRARGISNVMREAQAIVTLTDGVLLVVHTQGKA